MTQLHQKGNQPKVSPPNHFAQCQGCLYVLLSLPLVSDLAAEISFHNRQCVYPFPHEWRANNCGRRDNRGERQEVFVVVLAADAQWGRKLENPKQAFGVFVFLAAA